MNLLAFETSTRWVSVALSHNGNLIERHAELPNSGSEVLLPWVHALLAESGITLKQLDGVAFGAGPGGFTGLRLGCGVAQGLAWGLDRPVLPVGTLAALALNAGDGKVWTVLDARMNEVYAAAYRVSGVRVRELMAPRCSSPQVGAEAFAVKIAADPGSSGHLCAVSPAPTCEEGDEGVAVAWHGVGDGFETYSDLLGALPEVRIKRGVWPSAGAIARLAAPELAAGRGLLASEAQPLYVRDKVALTTAERLARGGVR